MFLGIYTAFIGTILIAGWHSFATKVRSDVKKINAKDVSVVIPFRNEGKNLKFLLDSIANQVVQPAEIIFVDDHSTDEGGSIIADYSLLDLKLKTLPDGAIGKKRAIDFGIDACNSEYILTLDADIILPDGYFESLNHLAPVDMWILPVSMEGNSLWQTLSSIDHVLVNAINTGVAKLHRPFIASGANLLFKRSVYHAVSKKDHYQISSGDDLFLLRDFRSANRNIQLSHSIQLTVKTDSPKKIKETIYQRIRWMSKTMKVGDILASTLAVVQVLITIVALGLFIYFICIGDLGVAVTLVLSKYFIDAMLLLPYFYVAESMKAWLLLGLYKALYPIYLIIILFGGIRIKPSWKGRAITQ
jgi:glycosyltransferase involved in cell wall biosynthesis